MAFRLLANELEKMRQQSFLSSFEVMLQCKGAGQFASSIQTFASREIVSGLQAYQSRSVYIQKSIVASGFCSQGAREYPALPTLC